jgi:hypothetical protein
MREDWPVCYITGCVVGFEACLRIVVSETGSSSGRIALRDSGIGMFGAERGFVAAETDLTIVVFVPEDLLTVYCDSEPVLFQVLHFAAVYLFEPVAAAELNDSVAVLLEVFSVLIVFVSWELVS